MQNFDEKSFYQGYFSKKELDYTECVISYMAGYRVQLLEAEFLTLLFSTKAAIDEYNRCTDTTEQRNLGFRISGKQLDVALKYAEYRTMVDTIPVKNNFLKREMLSGIDGLVKQHAH